MRRIAKSLVAATSSGVLLLASAIPAAANVRRFSDPDDTKSGIDIHWLKVDNSSASPNQVKVVAQIDHFLGADKLERLDLFIDTNGANPGPEYRLVDLNNRNSLYRVDGWSDRGPLVDSRCGRSTVPHRGYDVSRAASDRYVVTMKRGCIGKPGRIRLAVRTSVFDGHAVDWARAVRTFLGWVRR